MAKPYSIVPPREPLGFVDGKPVEISRVWWRFFSSQFLTTGGGQPGGGGNDNLNDLYALAYSNVESAGTDVDSRLSEIDLLLQAARPDAGAGPLSPDMEALKLLAGPRAPEQQQALDALLAAGRQPPEQEPRADLLLPARTRGTDFDAVTAELRKLIMAIRPQRVPSATDLGLGTMAFQNANAVAITGGTITVATLGLTGSQAQHSVLAAPAAGAGAPAFRLLVGADLPNPSATALGGTQSIAAVAHRFLTSISTAGVPASAQPAAADLSDGVVGVGAVVLQTYVDAAIQGLSIKPTATVATTAPLPANIYANGSAGVGATLSAVVAGVLTVDGVAAVLGALILVKNEAAPANNGLYTVTTAGAVGVAYVLTRHTDMDQAAEFSGAFIPVSSAGTTNANSLWLANPSGTVVVGTTAIPFTQMNGATDLTAGAGLTISGNTISISPTYVGQTSITTLGTIATGTWAGTPVAVAFGGTGDTGTAWTAYTPTITAATGAFTTVSATGRWKSIGKTVFLEIRVANTTNGTAAGAVVATLPTAGSASTCILAGRDLFTQAMLQGSIPVSSTVISIFKYDGTYPGTSGSTYVVTGVYESV